MKNNNEIRMAAQAIYRNIVTLRVNEMNGCKESQLPSLEARFDKAVDWAIENGEFKALRHICHQMFSVAAGCSSDFREIAEETFAQYFDNNYIWGLQESGKLN